MLPQTPVSTALPWRTFPAIGVGWHVVDAMVENYTLINSLMKRNVVM